MAHWRAGGLAGAAVRGMQQRVGQYAARNAGRRHTGFSVTVQVLADGHVEATGTLHRELTLPASVRPYAGTALPVRCSLRLRTGPTPPPSWSSAVGMAARKPFSLTGSRWPDTRPRRWATSKPGLPQCVCGIPLEYFAGAVGWLRVEPAARGRPVVLIGDSDGADAALLIASYEPHLVDVIGGASPGPF